MVWDICRISNVRNLWCKVLPRSSRATLLELVRVSHAWLDWTSVLPDIDRRALVDRKRTAAEHAGGYRMRFRKERAHGVACGAVAGVCRPCHDVAPEPGRSVNAYPFFTTPLVSPGRR